MRTDEIDTPDDEPIRIKLQGFSTGPDGKPMPNPAKKWIEKVYARFPQTWQNNHVMPMGGHGDDQQFALFELTPSLTKRGAVEIKWFQAYPLRQGVGSRAMKILQDLAQEDGISLTLFPWQHGRISQAKLKKFYKSMGFNPTAKDADNMVWNPAVDEAWSNSYKKSINCSNPKGFSQRAHCAARRKRQAGGKTKSKSVNESWQSAAQALEDYANQNISHEHPAFGDFMYHAELIRKGHQDIHREDLPKVAADYKDKLIDIVNKHTAIKESTVVLEVITAYHGSPKQDIRSRRFWPLSHFGTEKAAQDRMKMYAKHKKVFGKNPDFDYRIYQVALDINNPAMIKDEDVSHDPTQFAFALHKAKIFSKLEMMSVTVWPTIKSTSNEDYDAANLEARKYSREKQKQVSTKQLIKLLKSKGYDGMVYKNKHEDKGSLSYVILNPSQVRIVRSRQLNEEWSLEEADNRGDFSTVFRNRSNEAGGHRFNLTADEFVEHIDNQLSSGYNGDQAVVELATLCERHPHKIKDWPELVTVLNKHKAELIKIIKYHYTKELYHHAMTRSAMVSSALIAAGVAWPELQSMLEQNKAKVVKGLLTLVKDDADDLAIRQIRALRDVHVNWPELGIIHKSIAIESKPLNESTLPALDALLQTIEPNIAYAIKGDVAKMKERMYSGNYNKKPITDFLTNISVYALTIGKPKLQEVVNATKPLMLDYIEHVLEIYNKPFADHSHSDPLYWTLKSIARLKDRVGVDWPELGSLLETYKTGIVKTCLKQARLANSYSIEDLEGLLEQLTDIGVAWPELAIIKKSLSTGINESKEITAADLGDATNPELRTAARLATQLVHKMNMGYTFAITNTLGDMRTYMLDTDTQRLILNAVKTEIAEYITYLLNRSLEPKLPAQLVANALSSALSSILLVKRIGVDITELDSLIVSKKEQIIRAILLVLKNGNPTVVTFEVLSILSSLEELGLNWPEIEIVRKSVNSSRKRLRENELDQIYKDIDAENTKLNISQQLGIAKLRDLLRRGKLANGSMPAFMIHLKYLDLNDAQKATVYPQLDRDFAAFITRRIKNNQLGVVLDVLGGLVLNDIDCPNVVAVVNKHKPAVLKNLLAGIRTNYKQVGKLVTEIVNKKILDWPELDIIMKSINSPQLKEAELLDKPTPTVEELATKHNCTPQDVLIELRKGVAVEKEHTDRLELAREIALDHINEDLYYYEKLKKVENKNV